MTKQEMIDFIMDIDKRADKEFLMQFSLDALGLYVENLMELEPSGTNT